MKKYLLLILMFCVISGMNVNAKENQSKVVVGYKTITKTKKVKVKRKTYLGKFRITYYCPCTRCCGYGGGKRTASGTRPKSGRTVGVNRRAIRFGTKLKVGSKWSYVAEDTGGMGMKHLDIFCNSHREALRRGVDYKKVWSWKYVTKRKKYKIKVPIYEEVGKGAK